MSSIPLACALIGFAAFPADAQERPNRSAAFDPALVLMANIREGSTTAAYLANLRASFRAVDTDANGLDQEDVRRMDAQDIERARAAHAERRRAAEDGVARVDSNGDGAISEAELAMAMERESSGRDQVEQQFHRLDRNADGLIKLDELPSADSPGGREEFTRIDTDRNGGISFAELFAKVAPKRRDVPPAAAVFRQRDRNGDGRISIEEWAGPETSAAASSGTLRRRRDRFTHLFAFDPNRDGHLLDQELADAFHREFATIDGDGDGTVSRSETGAARSRIARAALIAESPACAVPNPSSAARAIAFAAGHGQLLSTVALGSQDLVTSIIDTEIEDGPEPLYLLLASTDPVIWRLSDATARIEKVVVFGTTGSAPGPILAAVVGVPAEKVHFGEPGCFSARSLNAGIVSADEHLAVTIGATTGITVQAAAKVGGAGKVALPSLTLSQSRGSLPAPEGFDPTIWWDATGTWPRGLTRPDLASLVSQAQVIDYNVLPGPMGPARLVAQGVLKPTGNYAEYRIMKPLARFPGGMFGGHASNFVVPVGMLMPAGDQGHGCIYSDKGAIIGKNTSCHRSPRGDALIAREREDGRKCLYSYGGKEQSCFPEDGRPLKVVETKEGRQIRPAEAGDADDRAPPPVLAVSDYRASVDIIPAGLSLRW